VLTQPTSSGSTLSGFFNRELSVSHTKLSIEDDKGIILRGYAVCTSARSGSNWFCMLLSSTGLLGYPREYFNFAGRRQFDDPNYPTETANQFDRILTTGATPNGVYGFKIFPHHHDAFAQNYAWTKLLPNLKFIWLKRGDVLGQALSSARSIQTGQFRSTLQASGVASYDPILIKTRLTTTVKEQARWSLFFFRTGIKPLEITYEDVEANPQAAVDQVADMIGIEERPPINLSIIELHPQRDRITEEWRARFLREEGSPDVLDNL
jgi:trehalose 2-sulfotransferase